MRFLTNVVAVGFVLLLAGDLAAQRPAVAVDDDDITIRGCVTRAGVRTARGDATPLLWSRGDIMLSAATGIERGTGGGRLFYWIGDDDLATHLGQFVEIKGELKNVEKGEIEIDRDGDFTTIELNLDGKKEKARVPSTWLGPAAGEEREYHIAVQRIDEGRQCVARL